MAVSYREHPLPPPLSAFVECVWFLRVERNGAPATSSAPERVVPDGCPELIVHLADPCRAGRPGQPRAIQPAAVLVGPLTSSLLLEPAGEVATMGVRFRPGGLAAFLRAPADELADREIAVENLFGREAASLADQVRSAGDDASRVGIVRRLLLSRLGRGARPAPALDFAVASLLARRGPLPVESLAREIGLSRRQLERAFRRRTGMTPTRLGRVLRFQSVFRALPEAGGNRVDWVSVALDCGYYDQSHLIRDFREFAGESPAAFLRETGSFGKVFTSPERLERFFG
jgi:AraC-like DNA-binding protein